MTQFLSELEAKHGAGDVKLLDCGRELPASSALAPRAHPSLAADVLDDSDLPMSQYEKALQAERKKKACMFLQRLKESSGLQSTTSRWLSLVFVISYIQPKSFIQHSVFLMNFANCMMSKIARSSKFVVNSSNIVAVLKNRFSFQNFRISGKKSKRIFYDFGRILNRFRDFRKEFLGTFDFFRHATKLRRNTGRTTRTIVVVARARKL